MGCSTAHPPGTLGGALYLLELYLLVRQVTDLLPGIYHYTMPAHALELLAAEPVLSARLIEIFMGQTYAATAALVVVLTAVPARSLWKYADRGYRLILLEADHVAQTLNLATAALGWGSVNLGGFLDMELGTCWAWTTNWRCCSMRSRLVGPQERMPARCANLSCLRGSIPSGT